MKCAELSEIDLCRLFSEQFVTSASTQQQLPQRSQPLLIPGLMKPVGTMDKSQGTAHCLSFHEATEDATRFSPG